jgi:hypothetical protein
LLFCNYDPHLIFRIICTFYLCREASFSESEHAQFYSQVPPMMVHFAHMHYGQQKMRAMQQQRLQEQQAALLAAKVGPVGMDMPLNEVDRGAGGAASGAGASASAGGMPRMGAEELKASGILQFLTSPEGRANLQALAMKVQDAKQRLEPEVASWDLERKSVYFDDFKEHPLLVELVQDQNGAASKIQALTKMTASEIDDLMRLLLIVSNEDGAAILKNLRAKSAAEAASNQPGTGTMLTQVIATMASLTGFARPPPGATMGTGAGPMAPRVQQPMMAPSTSSSSSSSAGSSAGSAAGAAVPVTTAQPGAGDSTISSTISGRIASIHARDADGHVHSAHCDLGGHNEDGTPGGIQASKAVVSMDR